MVEPGIFAHSGSFAEDYVIRLQIVIAPVSAFFFEERVVEDAVPKGVLFGKVAAQCLQEHRQIYMGRLLYLKTAVCVVELGTVCVNWNVIAEDVGVTGIASAPLDAFYVGVILTVADKGDRMVKADAKLLFQFAIGVDSVCNALIKSP